jgi:hypothetical protein
MQWSGNGEMGEMIQRAKLEGTVPANCTRLIPMELLERSEDMLKKGRTWHVISGILLVVVFLWMMLLVGVVEIVGLSISALQGLFWSILLVVVGGVTALVEQQLWFERTRLQNDKEDYTVRILNIREVNDHLTGVLGHVRVR